MPVVSEPEGLLEWMDLGRPVMVALEGLRHKLLLLVDQQNRPPEDVLRSGATEDCKQHFEWLWPPQPMSTK